MNDPVHNPKHYEVLSLADLELIVNEGRGLEAHDIIAALLTEEEYRGWCKGSDLGYRLRAGKKEDIVQDYRKAQVFTEWLLTVL